MASSSSATVPPSERASHFVSQTEIEMESAKASHWSQLDYSTSDSEWSAETNFNDFAVLKEDPEWGRFFRDFETLEVGEKISEGAQADIYEARMIKEEPGPFNLVVKVMKGDVPLKAFQAQWPIGMLLARSKHKRVFDLPLITILGGTVLRDQRVWGRFAFVMRRRWGDLRLMIDRRMKDRKTLGPFSLDEAIHLMLSIAEDVDTLHNKHDILHRDLKASNVLVWIGDGEAKGLSDFTGMESIGSVVADFECSVGVLGTGFWRAPEILEQLKDRVPCLEVRLTQASDVYSYGMICYEIITGCIPYDGLGGEDTLSQILQGHRPELPHDLPESIRDIIVGCWHSDPLERPSFSTICMALKLKKGFSLISVVIDNKSKRGASIVKVEQWKGLDCKGRKVLNDKSIANITKALSLQLLDETRWINANLDTSMDRNKNVQMHVVEVIAKSALHLGYLSKNLSRLFVATNFRVHSTRCRTRKGQVECFIYVEGKRMGTLLWKLRHSMEYFPISLRLLKIMVHRDEARDFLHLNRRLRNLESMDLTLPSNSTSFGANFCVHQRKEFDEGFQHSIEVVLCLKSQLQLVNLSHTLRHMGYNIVQASVKYPSPYRFLKGRVNKCEDIDVEGEDESKKISIISGIALQRGCFDGNCQLIVSGPSEELYDDLVRSLDENYLIVSGGQICGDGWEFDTKLLASPIQSLEFFVIGKYNS